MGSLDCRLTMSNSKVQQWREWLQILNNEVTMLYLHRHIWRVMATTIDGNPGIPRSYAMNFLYAAYTTSQAVAVRRLIDTDRRVVSFVRLLNAIKADPHELTARQVLPPDRAFEASAWEFRYAGSKPGGYVDPSLAARHLATLEARVGPIRDYVNQHAAHLNVNPLTNIPAYQDLNAAIDCLVDLGIECHRLLHNADLLVSAVPKAIGDFMAPFRVPWLEAVRRRG